MRGEKCGRYRDFIVPDREYSNTISKAAELLFKKLRGIYRRSEIPHINGEDLVEDRQRVDAAPFGAKLMFLRLPDLVTHSRAELLPI